MLAMLVHQVLSLVAVVLMKEAQCSAQSRPNIVMIVIDDLGWNDVGFHGSKQIPTPNIDGLASSGVILNRYYVTPLCTPTRSAIMTGKLPIHTGLQDGVITGNDPRGIPLSDTLLPQYLQNLGYRTHAIGKWHLGHFQKKYLPTNRGFDTHMGHWLGYNDYFDHTIFEDYQTPVWGYDLRRNLDVAYDAFGHYSTDLYTDEAVAVISHHNNSQPMFLYLAHQATHSATVFQPLQAPVETVNKFNHIKDKNRRIFAAMMSKVDDSVGRVVEALALNKMLSNTVIIFTTDNGGPAAGFNNNAASNWPLRGMKHTVWEGGVRAAGFVWSLKHIKSPYVSTSLMSVEDWLPTLYEAAGGPLSDVTAVDGVSQWKMITQNVPAIRKEVLHQINRQYAAITVGDYKLVTGFDQNDGWYGPSGRDEPLLNVNLRPGKEYSVVKSLLKKYSTPMKKMNAEIICQGGPPTPDKACHPSKSHCLYNTVKDPCEYHDLSDTEPDILTKLKKRLAEYNATAVAPNNPAQDPRADPKYFDYVWTNWYDYI